MAEREHSVAEAAQETHFIDLDFELLQINRNELDELKLHASPFAWPMQRKIRVLAAPFAAAMFAAYSAGAYGMGAAPIEAEWGLSTITFNLGITIFVMSFGFSPVILALISELYGRYWVFVGSGIVFLIGMMGCAVTQSFGGMLVSRLISGCGASVFATLTGGVVGDLFPKQTRNTPMALYSIFVMAGTGLGPLISGIVAQHLQWRWIFYLQLIIISMVLVGLLFVFQETRANVLLARNCHILNAHIQKLEDAGGTGARSLLVDAETVCSEEKCPGPCKFRFQVLRVAEASLGITIWQSFKFPLKLLATESIVFWFSAWVSFAWSILYMQFSSISLVYRTVYGFNIEQIGAVYVAIILGSVTGGLVSIASESMLRSRWPSIASHPESRLYFSCVGSLLLPAGLFWFGWSARPDVHWIVPTIAIGVFIVGIFIIYLAVFNYLADAYGQSASSALAAQSMCRNLLAGVFPLFTNIMFTNLGYGQTGSLLGGIAVGLCFVPWLLCLFGDEIRGRSPLIKEMVSH